VIVERELIEGYLSRSDDCLQWPAGPEEAERVLMGESFVTALILLDLRLGDGLSGLL
jgi:hypothetical protein